MWAAAVVLTLTSLARAGDEPASIPGAQAPLELPHTTNVLLDEQARKARRKPDNVESLDFLMLTPGLLPVLWPKNTDMRARILTTQVKSTPVVGWLAENLYRDKSDNGWSLEVDPGNSKYVVFYRFHPVK
jgi:hypothetical protein